MLIRPPVRLLPVAASLALAALLGCGGGSGSAPAASTQSAPVAVTITPEQALQTVLRPQTFRAAVSGSSNTAVTWSVVSGGGSIDAQTGVYTAAATPGTAVVRATSVANPSVSATQAVTLVAAPAITGFTTSKALVPFGGSATLTPTFSTDGTAVITPSVTGGAVTSGAGYAVSPAAITSYTLTVTNSAGTSVAATVTVDVQTAQVSIAPASVVVTAGTTQQFGAVVGGAVNTGVSWSANGGSINSAGLYTAPATPGSYAVVATSAADASKSVLASVKVVAAPSISAFTAAKSTLSQGNGTVLSCTFSGGTGVIDHGVGAVVSGGTANVAPDATSKYSLTVTNEAGASVKSAVDITVVPQPVATLTVTGVSGSSIPSWTRFNASVPAQAGCTYAWSTINGSVPVGSTSAAATLSTGNGGASSTFTCTVTNAAGDTAKGSVTYPVTRHWQPMTTGPAVGTYLEDAFGMSYDDSGATWMAWVQQLSDGINYGIYASFRTGTTWSTPVRLDSAPASGIDTGSFPQVASDNKGHAVVIWSQNQPAAHTQIWGSRYTGSAWTTAARLDTCAATDRVSGHQVGMDANGNGVAVWIQGPSASVYDARLWGSTLSAGSWQTPVAVSNQYAPGIIGVTGQPSLAMDPNGRAVAVWLQTNSSSYASYYSVFDAGSWRYPDSASYSATPLSYGTLAVRATTDNQGHALIAFPDYDSAHSNLYVATKRVALDQGVDGFINRVAGGPSSAYPVVEGLGVYGTRGAISYITFNGSVNTSRVALEDPVTGTWGAGTALGDPNYENRYSDLFVDNLGNVAVSWYTYAAQRVAIGGLYDAGLGDWTAPTLLVPGPNFAEQNQMLRYAPNGRVGQLAVLCYVNGGKRFYFSEYK